MIRVHVAAAMAAWVVSQTFPASATDSPAHEGGVTVQRAPTAPPLDAHEVRASEVRAVPRSDAAELLTAAPGMVLSRHGGDGKAYQFFFRGFDAQHGQDLAFEVGGAPANDIGNVHGQGYADLGWLPAEAVDRVVLDAGPFDPASGDFAVAGRASFDLGVSRRGARVSATGGSFGTFGLSAVLAPRDAPRETFAALEFQRSDGFGPSRASWRVSALGQSLWRLPGGLQVRAWVQTSSYTWQSAGLVREPDFIAGRQGFFDTRDPNQGGTSQRHGAFVEVTVPLGGGRLQLRAHGAYRRFDVRENYTGFTLGPRGDGFVQSYEAGLGGATAEFQRAWDFVVLDAGLSVRHDRGRTGMQRVDPAGTPWRTDVDANLVQTDLGGWASVQWRRLPRWLSLRAGVRLDGLFFAIDDHLPRASNRGLTAPRGERQASGVQAGPRASIEFAPWAETAGATRGLVFGVSYGRGFRSAAAWSLGNGEFAPFATVDAGEAVVRWSTPYGSADLSGFVTHVTGDLVFDPVSGTNVPLPNGGATLRVGAAGSVRLRPVPGLFVGVSATWTRATKDDDGTAVPYAPTLVARMDATYERTVGTVRGLPVRIDVAAGASFVGLRPLPFGERAEPFALLDMALGGALGPFRIHLALRNVTDARWWDAQFTYASSFDPASPVSLLPVRHFTAGRPFTALVTTEVEF